jgi:CheY-like chemotaxis protein
MVDVERPTILLVDDNPQVRDLLTRFLDDRYDVVHAGDGERALEALRGLPDIQLVLTDVNMPNMDGLQLTRTIRRRYPGLAVVIITGMGREEVAIDALRAGATNYLRKPFKNAELDKVVRQSLELSQHRRRFEEGHAYLLEQTKLFELPPDLLALARALPHLTQGVVEVGVASAQDLIHIEVALQEALLNAIVHGSLELEERPVDRAALEALCRDRRTEPRFRGRVVRVAVELTPDALRVVIEDQGPGFDEGEVSARRSGPTGVAGRGLFLMRSFMDEVTFEDGGRRVGLVRRRGSPKSSRDAGEAARPGEVSA